WVKIWGNVSLNPVSALTNSTIEDMLRDPGTHGVIRQMMVEAQQVGEKLGVRFGMNVDQRIKGAQEVGAHRTSMLQDLERGRRVLVDEGDDAVEVRRVAVGRVDAQDRRLDLDRLGALPGILRDTALKLGDPLAVEGVAPLGQRQLMPFAETAVAQLSIRLAV